jgi:hypothetical protein
MGRLAQLHTTQNLMSFQNLRAINLPPSYELNSHRHRSGKLRNVMNQAITSKSIYGNHQRPCHVRDAYGPSLLIPPTLTKSTNLPKASETHSQTDDDSNSNRHC